MAHLFLRANRLGSLLKHEGRIGMPPLRLTFGDMPDSRRRKVLGLNAAKLYNFDLEELKARAAKVGPTLTFYDNLWPKFLRDNSRKVLKLRA